jgi:NAD(P)-dependent dehydrogenase (short-subunit alcohol dehydrogenase family)
LEAQQGTSAGRRRFSGKVAVVTGVSTGIGRALCEVFADDGAAVVGIARRAELGRALERSVRKQGGDLTFVAGDVSLVEDCERVIRTAVDTYGRVDFLVNNAAVHAERQFIPTHQVTEADWDLVVNTNLKGTFFCSRFALAHMKHQGGGVIVNVSSNNAVKPTAGMAAYNSSKAAILQLSRTIAVEYYRYNIRCTAITLGGVDTPKAVQGGDALRELFGGERGDAADRDSLSELLLSPEAVARAIALLCDDDAAPFFAAVVAVDGGATAHMESGGAYVGVDIAGALDRLDVDISAFPSEKRD